jgi:hypothetical protein
MSSYTSSYWSCFAALMIGLCPLGTNIALLSAADAISIELWNGHIVRGEPDIQTDEHRLWIRRESSGVQIASGFPWQDIHYIQSGNQRYSGHDFFPEVQKIKTAGQSYRELAPGSSQVESAKEPLAATGGSSTSVGDDMRRSAARRRVQTLYIEAYLAQWDGDAQTDGLRVFVYPLAADGELVPVYGQIDLFLLGEVERATGVVASPVMPQFRELERGSHMVRPGDFVRPNDLARGAAMYELPFRQFHPDFYFDVARQALVHARLGVPGQGLFLASDANVQLRGFSRIRDELQMRTQQRFFPAEDALERPGVFGHLRY